MNVREKYTRVVKECISGNTSARIPIPSGEHAVAVISMLISQTKKSVRICIDDFENSIFNHPVIREKLKLREVKVLETELCEGVPGYFAVFDDNAYIYQKGVKNGFIGTANFNDEDIAKGMLVGWDILKNKNKGIKKK